MEDEHDCGLYFLSKENPTPKVIRSFNQNKDVASW